MKALSTMQERALNFAASVPVPMSMTHFPEPVGAETIATLAARGFLHVEVTLTNKGRHALQEILFAKQRRARRDEMQSRLRRASQAELMGGR